MDNSCGASLDSAQPMFKLQAKTKIPSVRYNLFANIPFDHGLIRFSCSEYLKNERHYTFKRITLTFKSHKPLPDRAVCNFEI